MRKSTSPLAAGMVCLLLASAGNSARAQHLAANRAGLRILPGASFDRDTAGPKAVPVGALAVRAALATAAWVPGAVAGGAIAYRILPHTPNGDDPGLREFMQGAAIGGTLVAAVGAAAPSLDSECSFATRVGRSFLGSSLGAAAGFLAQSHSARVLTVPILSITGATLAEWRC